MPIYVFRCDVCGRELEIRMAADNRDDVMGCLSAVPCPGLLRRHLGSQLKTARFAEVAGTENGPYARSLVNRMEQNAIRNAEFEKHNSSRA